MSSALEILRSAGAQLDSVAHPRIGIVASSDSSTATVRVQIQPENVLSGWLPVAAQWVGSGWGISCPPSIGDQVVVIFQEGSVESGIVIGRLYSNAVRPPEAALGELIIRHQTGSTVRLANDGIIYIDGDLHVSGDVYDGHGALSALRHHYNGHTHTDSRGGQTSAPNPVD